MKYQVYDIVNDDMLLLTNEEYIARLEQDIKRILIKLDQLKPLPHSLRELTYPFATRIAE